MIAWLEAQLRQGGVVSARAEAEWFVAELLGLNRNELYLCDKPLEPQALEALQGLLARRLHGEPFHYVVGCAVFLGHRLAVSSDVLIPRPETEVLTDHAIRYLAGEVRRSSVPVVVLDVGTGSGNIAISIAMAIPSCLVMAVELSWKALQLAKTNAAAHRMTARIQLIQSDWTSGVRGPVALIMSNPPYVPTQDVQAIPLQSVWEPWISLDGGDDGMAFHHRLIADLPRLLQPGGAACLECAEAQAEPLASLVSGQSWVRRVQ
ncbi:MAG: peptide chain release factor N(5)-glutamine methyltransferase, partial [Candidatus Omnitrophica bacterium]|nr:peptide chain release factor N(5)-glutamine methyltransferase [Candidatus Omnitrophota bacterium]